MPCLIFQIHGLKLPRLVTSLKKVFDSMPTYKSVSIPTCYASCSIGHDNPAHTLENKLHAISDAGFDAIELSMPDLLSFAAIHTGKDVDPKDYDSLCSAGNEVKKLCQQLNLKILILQPFANFEGWPKGSPERKDAFERARGWPRIMEAVGTAMLQVGSSDAEGISEDYDVLAGDLRELGDMLAEKGMRVAYENWCWATHAPSWKDVWEIVKKVDRENVGLCLDTFQSAGGEWGDPRTKSGLNQQAGFDAEQVGRKWKESLAELAKSIPAEKIFFLQISDAYKMDPPMKDETDQDGMRPRGQWSHDYRPLPYDGGYLPVEDFTRAVLETGFRGWLSIEVFDGKAKEKYQDDMKEYAKKAMRSLERLLEAC